jgi:hypothetical protein
MLEGSTVALPFAVNLGRGIEPDHQTASNPGRGQSAPRLLLVIDIRERLPALIADDKTSANVLNRPGRWERRGATQPRGTPH